MGEVISNFRQNETESWGESVHAVREWPTLNSRAVALEQELETLEFEGSVADGGVTVALNGRQRPIALRIAPEAAIAENLGLLLVEAHANAFEASLNAMTEKLQ